MKNNKYIGLMMAAAMLAATSCSDFNDYNEVPSDALPEGNQTLWQNISSNQDLTDFADLVKQAGFDGELDKSRTYTVFAPKNGSFIKSEFEGMERKDLLQQFVKNHIAEYNHVATGAVNMRIHTLNEKSYLFEGNGNYTFGGMGISKPNMPSNNGVVHMLERNVPFYPNLYEYLKVGENIDSLRNHFMRYEVTYLDEKNSVKGPMVDGMQTYIDSVMITRNYLVEELGAKLENEDSSYTFIMPTSEAFKKYYDKATPYYNYITEMKVQDVTKYETATDTKSKTINIPTTFSCSAAYLRDSLVRRMIVNDLIYSNNNGYNKWIVGKGENTDTIRSTTRDKFSNPKDLLETHIVGAPIPMSNGYGRLVDELAFKSWETYCPEININPRNNLSNLFPANASANRSQTVPEELVKKIFGPEFKESSYKYMWIIPGGEKAKPDFTIALPNVKSTKYNFYVVFLPTAMEEFGNEPRTNWLNFELNYTDAKGNLAKYYFSKPYADALKNGGTLPAVPKKVDTTTAFNNDPAKTNTNPGLDPEKDAGVYMADTIFIGQFDFPVSYYGLGDYYPSIRVTSPISVLNKKQLEQYSRDVRIAAIILKPVELEEYEANNK